MKKKIIAGWALGISILCSSMQSFAGTITFEDMPQDYWYAGGQQNFGDYWAGVNFGPQSTILEDQVYGYNSFDYPAHSGHAVLFSIDFPSITATFQTPVDFVSLWYSSSSDFYLDAYDADGNLIAQSYGGSNLGTNNYIQVNTATNSIDHVIMHDSGNNFTVDDFTAPIVTGSPTPEPASILLLGTGLVGLASTRRRFRKNTA